MPALQQSEAACCHGCGALCIALNKSDAESRAVSAGAVHGVTPHPPAAYCSTACPLCCRFAAGEKKVSLWLFASLVAGFGVPLSFLCW